MAKLNKNFFSTGFVNSINIIQNLQKEIMWNYNYIEGYDFLKRVKKHLLYNYL